MDQMVVLLLALRSVVLAQTILAVVAVVEITKELVVLVDQELFTSSIQRMIL
jgi:hypothetical protein